MQLIQNSKGFVRKHYFLLGILGIIIVAIFFRFYHYPDRWGLGADQARDAIIIKRSVLNHSFPLIGPFSASGPFVFGSTWYLIFIIGTFLFPRVLLGPWIFQSILFVAVVPLIIYIGTITHGKKLGLLLGLLTAISTAQINASTNLIFSSFEIIIATLVLLCFIFSIDREKRRYVFLLGLLVGIAITVHFEAVPFLILFPIVFLLRRFHIKDFLLLLMGFFLPFIPLGIFNILSHSYESSNIIHYFLNRSDNPTLPNRWLIYAFISWPRLWADMIGGFGWVGGIAMGVTLMMSGYAIARRIIPKSLAGILVWFLCVFILLRYFNGVLFESFLSFLQPFIIFITGWMCISLYRLKKPLGIIFVIILLLGSSIASFQTIQMATNNTAITAKQLQDYLTLIYPNQKFAIYDYQYKNTAISLPLTLFLFNKQQTKYTDSLPIGVAEQQIPNAQILYEVKSPYHVFLYKFPSEKHPDTKNWIFVNPTPLYASVEDWYK